MKLHEVSREWPRRRQLELQEQVERDESAEISRSFAGRGLHATHRSLNFIIWVSSLKSIVKIPMFPWVQKESSNKWFSLSLFFFFFSSFFFLFCLYHRACGTSSTRDQTWDPCRPPREVPPLLLNLNPLFTLHKLPLTSFPVLSLGSLHSLRVPWPLWFSPPCFLFLPLCPFPHTPRWAWNVLFQPTLLLGKSCPSRGQGLCRSLSQMDTPFISTQPPRVVNLSSSSHLSSLLLPFSQACLIPATRSEDHMGFRLVSLSDPRPITCSVTSMTVSPPNVFEHHGCFFRTKANELALL